MTQGFVRSETGAVTVDWVVLTAGLVGLGLAAMAVVSGGAEDLSNDIDSQLKEDHINRTNFGYAPTIASVAPFQSGYSSTYVCADGESNDYCGQSISGTESFYNMTNGDQWTYRETTINGDVQEPYWVDPDGNELSLDNGPTIPENVPIG